MSKPKKNSKKPLNKREREKYPNLKKETNLKTRREYIDTFYIDGIYDSKGKQVMRPLTTEEKSWLDQFYKENLNASFAEKGNLNEVLEDKERKKVKKQLKKLRDESAKIQKEINDNIVKNNKLAAKRADVEKEIKELLETDKKKRAYDENNARNRCLYNQSRKTGKLIKLSNDDYDQFSVEWMEKYDWENLIVNDRDLWGDDEDLE
jgi:seryl-tRNA synthetase